MDYDVIVVGGGIAGSVAARLAAEAGFRTLLLERKKTPRNKPCSGIQWGYFERLLGVRVPPEKLCRNALSRVEIVTPSGRRLRSPVFVRTLNFWRDTFDAWLNALAAAAGADFCDQTALVDFAEENGVLRLRLATPTGEKAVVARYLIAADGPFSHVRRKLQPQIDVHAPGGGINYYISGTGALDANTLYMVYNRDFAPLMFAWIYCKDDLWVVGTGADRTPTVYAERFLRFVRETYGLQGRIVRREGFASPLNNGVFLGQGRVLLAGDAAGLIDLYRGMGMDNAALSGRLAARALCVAAETGQEALSVYQGLMQETVENLERNARRRAALYASDEALSELASAPALLRGGLRMLPALIWNQFAPPEKVRLLPL